MKNGIDRLTRGGAQTLVAELTGVLDFVVQRGGSYTGREIAETVANQPSYQRAIKLFDKIEVPSC